MARLAGKRVVVTRTNAVTGPDIVAPSGREGAHVVDERVFAFAGGGVTR